MFIYHFINTPAGEFKSENVNELSSEYLRDQAFFLHREEQLICRKHALINFERYSSVENKHLNIEILIFFKNS